MTTAIEARMRLFGLSEVEARLPEASTVIGRMRLCDDLSFDQYFAALRYIEARNAYHRAIGTVPDTGREPAPLTPGAATHEDFCRVAGRRWNAVRAAIRQVCQDQRSPGPASALDHFLIRDCHVPELVGDLRIALNALHRHFGAASALRDGALKNGRLTP